MTTSNYIVSSQDPLPTERKLKGRGNKIVKGTVVNDKIGELEEVRVGNSRRMRKELTGLVQGVSGRRRFLARFHNGCKEDLSANQLTVVLVDKIPVEEEPLVSTITEIPEDQVEKEKGYYCYIYVMVHFKKKVGVESKEVQADVEDDPDEEEMDIINKHNEREHQCKIIFEYSGGGVDDKKALLHAKRWYLHVNEKEHLVKVIYLVEFFGHDKKKVLWVVVEDHVVEEPRDHKDI